MTKELDQETASAGLIKGKTACNRSACQAPLNDKDGSRWWNTSTCSFYCKLCAYRINKSTGVPILTLESDLLKRKPEMIPDFGTLHLYKSK